MGRNPALMLGNATVAIPQEDLFSANVNWREEPEAEEYPAQDQFNDWKEKPGANYVLKHCYRWAAHYSTD